MVRFWSLLMLRFVFGLLFCVTSTPLLAQMPLPTPSPRIAQAIDSNSRFTLRGSFHPLTARYPDAGAADATQPITGLTIYFTPTAAQEAALKSLLVAQQTPGSPEYHHWLTPAQYAGQFGLAPADVSAISAWLQQQGFQILSSSPLFIRFSGTVGQVESAFSTEIHNYNVNGAIRRSNASALSLPTALQGIVSSVRGLSEFRPRPRVRHSVLPHYSAGGNNYFVAPADFATLYDLGPLYSAGYTGTGETIAVVGQTEIQASDIANFRSAAGLPANTPTMTLVSGSGTAVVSSADDEEESDLDVEWSGAVARNATINFVYVGNKSSSSVFDSLQYAIDNDLAPVISISYGACEAQWSNADITAFEQMFQQANSQGQTIVAAAGDTGAADCDDSSNSNTVTTQATQGLAVDYPGSSPYVTSIGGTEFYGDGSDPGAYWNSKNGAGGSSAIQYIPAEVWNDTSAQLGLEAGGGGSSSLFGKPSWQTGTGVPSDGARDVPDISLNASPQHDGYLYCSSANDSTSCKNGFLDGGSNPTVAGGTSFGAPTFAGILTLINEEEKSGGQGNFNPAIYTAAGSSYSSAFHDVTTGNNQVPCKAGSTDCGSSGVIGYTATVGYDLASGWGAIDANNFATAVQSTTTTTSPSATVSISAPTTTPTAGKSVTFTAVVSVSGGTTTPTGTVQFQVNGANSGSAVTLTAASAGTADATFSYTFSTAGSYTITAVYSGNSGSNISGSINVTVGATTSAGKSFALSAANVTVASGASGTSTITVTPSGGYTGTVAFTVSSPSSLTDVCFPSIPNATVNGPGPATTTLTVDVTDRGCGTTGSNRALAGNGPATQGRGTHSPILAAGVMLLSLVFLGVPALRRQRGLWMLVLLLGFGTAGLMGCGTSSAPKDTTALPGSYTITVTGTDSTANLSESTSFTLTIQ